MSEQVYTLCECRYCCQPVRASRHSVEECRETILGQRDRLRQALADYGEHDGGCPKRYLEPTLSAGLKTQGVCECGLDEELKAEEPA